MSNQFRIEITGEIPVEHEDLGAQATIDTREMVAAIVKHLEGIGLKNIRSHRKVGRKADPKPAASTPGGESGATISGAGSAPEQAPTVAGGAHRGPRPVAAEQGGTPN